MTRTEERLADALHASAARVQDDNLRPFPAPEPGTEPRARRPAPEPGTEPRARRRAPEPGTERRARRRAAWRPWLVPAAAAASVALVIGLAVAVTGGPARTGQSPAVPGRAAGPVAGFPEYFVQVVAGSSGRSAEIRSVSTGLMVVAPPVLQVPGWSLRLDTAAAAPDGKTFYLDYDADRVVKSSVTRELWIYRVSITASGSVTPLTRIKGGEISGGAALGTGGSMAVSPDGTRLALTTADTTVRLSRNTQGWPDQVIVVDLRTGLRSVWQGGLYRSGLAFTISDISWTANGRSLVFLALWCADPGDMSVCGGTPGPHHYRDTQVRSLSVGTGGGTLGRSEVLLTQSARYPVIASVTAGPGPAELTAVVLSGPRESDGAWSTVVVYRFSTTDGAVLGVAYYAGAVGEERQPNGVAISADPSGRYQLLTYIGPLGLYTGWIGSGRLHLLPVPYLLPKLLPNNQKQYPGGIAVW
jgi:hypothetical protein